MQTVSMPTTVTLRYARKGENYFGAADVPTRRGLLRFRVMVPMPLVKEEVKRYLATQPPEIAGDPLVAGHMGQIYEHVAKDRARRRLATAIKVKFGGEVKPYEVAGPAGFGFRIAAKAVQKARAARGWGAFRGVAGEDEIGWNPFKAVYKGVKAVGKGVAKGTVAVAKGVGKGAAATGKFVFKGGKAAVSNPITRALISVAPGGGAALAIADAARGGSPGAQQAIQQVHQLAKVDATAAESARKLAEAQALLDAKKSGPSPALLIGGGVGALALLMMMKKK